MKTIKLTKGYEAIVDDDMYEIINRFGWCVSERKNTAYAVKRLGGNKIDSMHWHIVGKPIKGYDVDHINGNGLDNRRENLRIITHRQNGNNTDITSSVCPGVRKKGKFEANIRIEGRPTYLGRYDTEIEAFAAYRCAIHNIGCQLLPEHEELYLSMGGTP